MNLYLSDMGVINALGTGKAQVRERLLHADQSGMVRHGSLLTGRSTTVARVREDLKPLPHSLAEFDCRNNRLLAAALDQIVPSVAALRATVPAERIAVVIGT